MPKRSSDETQKLIAEAFRLLDSGYTKQDVAAKLGVNIRTVQRWIAEKDYQPSNLKAQRELEQISLETVAAKKVVVANNLPDGSLEDLEDYAESQRWFALQLGTLAAKLLPNLQETTEQIMPEDIPVRALPQLLKAVADLADTSSACWARATGLEEILNVFNQQIKESRKFEASSEESHISDVKREY